MYKEEKNNKRLNYEYLQSRHTDPALKQQVEITEFSCADCRTNVAIELMARYEAQRTRKFNYIPPKLRKVISAGLTFTRDSVMFEAHKNHKKAEGHNWFMSQPVIAVPIGTY